ncbi:MAG: GyrI-like domain-containing protein [Pseudomonadota bacterium]
MNLEPEFLESTEKQLVALSREYTLDTRNEIPALWNEFWGIEIEVVGTEEQAAYGVSYEMQADGRFMYGVGRNIDPLPDPMLDGMCAVTLSAGTYAVFANKGPVSELPSIFDWIFTEWLPNSGKMHRDGAVFERYPYDDDASPESMSYEIWVPVAS